MLRARSQIRRNDKKIRIVDLSVFDQCMDIHLLISSMMQQDAIILKCKGNDLRILKDVKGDIKTYIKIHLFVFK